MPTFFFGLRNREEMATKIDPDLLQELESLAAASGCELVHCEFKGAILRLFIDRPEGVTLEHCEHVSRQASALLDVAGFGPSRYTLEVSSPGLDRQLYRPRDYRRFTGRLVRVTFRPEGEEGRRRTVVGRLEALAGDDEAATVVLRVSDVEGVEPLAIPLASVQTARLEIEL